MKDLLTRLEQWLAKNRPLFHTNLQHGAAAKDLEALALVLGKPVPEPLRHLLSWHNGQGDDYVGYFDNHWLLMSADTIADAKQALDANGTTDGWNTAWIPILDDDGGNFLCVDSSKQDLPLVAYYGGEPPSRQVATSLEAWLGDFVTAVEAGQYYEEPERGTFKRN